MVPVRLEMKNFASHVYSVIDFTLFNTALIVGACEGNPNISNAVGKSSIFDAIRFVLYGKSRFNKKEKVVKRGKYKCVVKFMFTIDDEFYKVKRTFNKKTGSIDVLFFKKVDDKWVSKGYICDTPTITTSKIEKIIGMNHDTFVNSIFFRQNDISGFAGAKVTKRREILKEILQIGIWDKYQETAKKNEKDLEKQKNILDNRIEIIGDAENEKEVAEKTIEKIDNSLSRVKIKIEELESKILKCDDDIVSLECTLVKKDTINIKNLKKRLSFISSRMEEIKVIRDRFKKEVQNNNIEISNANNDCINLENKLLNIAKNVLLTDNKCKEKALFVFKKNKKKIPLSVCSRNSYLKNKERRDRCRRDLDILKMQLSQLTSLEPGSECPICLENIENPKDVFFRRESKKKFLENQILEKDQEVSEMSNEIEKEERILRKSEEAIIEMERTELIIAKRMAIISEVSRKNDEIRNKFSEIAKEWSQLKDERKEIFNLINNLEDVSSRDDLNNVLLLKKELKVEISRAREEIIKLSIKQGHLKALCEELEKKISEKHALTVEKDKLIYNIKVYSKLVKAFGKDGIQAIILENVTDDLRKYANSILKYICSEPMSVDFVTQKQTTSGEWREDFEISICTGNDIVDFGDLSGGEQIRVSIALRLALSRLLMQRVGSNIQFLLLDEVDQSLDTQGIEALAEVIHILSNEFKILIITHNESMKEKFEHTITVFKGPTGSVIRQ